MKALAPNVLKEPLLHFLVAGALLFAAYAWLDHGGDDAPRVVRITEAEVNWLAEIWTRQSQRPPDQEQLRGIVTDYLREQLLAREALELGLDENDTVVRQRLAQKMQFLVQDTARLAEPSEDTLRAFYAADRARYQARPRISFTQLFFQTEAAAERGLAELETQGPDELGERILLERELARIDEQGVANLFGGEFAAGIFAYAIGEWRGPIASSYGFHLVRVTEREAAEPRPFEEVRAEVLEEWRYVEQTKAEEQLFATLLEKYELVIDESIAPLLEPLAPGAR